MKGAEHLIGSPGHITKKSHSRYYAHRICQRCKGLIESFRRKQALYCIACAKLQYNDYQRESQRKARARSRIRA